MIKKIICILGPSGAGKSYIGHEIAKEINGEIISCDSIQVYKYFDIGTDKVSLEKRKEIRYHLIDILEPDSPRFSAGDFKKMFEKIAEEIIFRGKIPILVGGTGLYYKAIRVGMFEGPKADHKIREKLYRIAKLETPKILYEKLKTIDPEYASKISENDLKRIIRALEVYELTGRKFSDLHKNSLPSPFKFISFVLLPEREKLYSRINQRVDEMIKKGLIDEVKCIVEKYGHEIYPLSSIGYKEILSFLKGEIELENAIYMIKKNTRNLAKRQITLFRHTIVENFLHFDSIDLQSLQEVKNRILNVVFS